MEPTPANSSKGYQKKLPKKDPVVPATPKEKRPIDYSSPTAKKWPLLLEALDRGDVGTVRKLVDEGLNVNVMRDGVTPLMMAVAKGQREIAEVFLQAGVNVNERAIDGQTALHIAAVDPAGAALVDLLLQSGINISAKDRTGKTALQLAEEKGLHDIIREFTKHHKRAEADAQEWEEFLNTPDGEPYRLKHRIEKLSSLSRFWWVPLAAAVLSGLMIGSFSKSMLLSAFLSVVVAAAIYGSFFLRDIQLQKKLNEYEPFPQLSIHTLREKRKAGESVAVRKKRARAEEKSTSSNEFVPSPPPVVLSTSPSPSEVDTEQVRAPRNRAAWFRSSRVAQAMRYAAIAITALSAISIVIAILFSRNEITQWYYAKMLEQKGLHATGSSYLGEIASNNGEALELFWQAGVPKDVKNEQGQTSVFIAADKGLVDLLRKLAEAQPSLLIEPDQSGTSPLMAAARRGNAAVVELLIESGAEVNYRSQKHTGVATALQAAADAPEVTEDRVTIVKLLLQHGADVHAKDPSNRSPLLMAVQQGNAAVAAALIAHDADVNEPDNAGNFPLMAAACMGRLDIITALADKGATMTAGLPDGQTPLMCAVRSGNVEAVKALLARDVNINARTGGGSSALTDASRSGNVDIVRMLLDQGADPSGGYLPDAFTSLAGTPLAVQAKKARIGDLLQRITKTAAQDGYAVIPARVMERRSTVTVKRVPWNKALIELAKTSRSLLVVKDREVNIVPYQTTAPQRNTR